MTSTARIGLLAAALTLGAATAAGAGQARTYILNGYSFGGMSGLNTAELTAKMKHHEGARITQADVAVDQAILTKELQARHIKGRLFASLAEKHGRVWVIFDLQDPDSPGGWRSGRRLKSQTFEGGSGVPEPDLTAATGLKPGDALSPGKIKAAHQAILDLYAKSMPGHALSIRAKVQTAADGEATLTWIIGDK